MQVLFGRFPVASWAQTGRYWYGDRELVDKLRTDPFRYLDGTPSKGAARRDEIVGAWDGWKPAERSAIVEPWSNGQTEGQVTKLKLVRRQMYDRGKVDLLHARMVQPW